ACDAADAQSEAALEALPGIGAGNVTVTRLITAGTVYELTFTNRLGHGIVPLLSARAAFTGDPNAKLTFTSVVDGNATTDAVQQLSFTGAPAGGTFTLTFDAPADTQTIFVAGKGGGSPPGQPTAAIQWDDDAAKIQTALENLANIGKGNVTVERLTTVGTTEFAVTFVGTLRARPVPTLKVTSSLVGANPGLTVRMATVGLPGSTNAVQELTFAAGV